MWWFYICVICEAYKPTPTYPACDDCNAAEFYSQFDNMP